MVIDRLFDAGPGRFAHHPPCRPGRATMRRSTPVELVTYARTAVGAHAMPIMERVTAHPLIDH
jgi:hypothetical protein